MEVDLQVFGSMLVSELKQEISHKFSIPLKNMVLVAGGEYLKDETTLYESGIYPESIIV